MAGTRATLLPRVGTQRPIQLDAITIARDGGAITPFAPDAGGAPFPVDRVSGRHEPAARQRQRISDRRGSG